MEKREKALNDFEKKVATEAGIAPRELLLDNLRYDTIAKAKLLGAVKHGVKDPNFAMV